jgi:hypothetical protein
MNLVFYASPQDPGVAARFAVRPRQVGSHPQLLFFVFS